MSAIGSPDTPQPRDADERPTADRKGTMTTRSAVSTSRAPSPAHTFSQGVRAGNLLQVSGQGPVDPTTYE